MAEHRFILILILAFLLTIVAGSIHFSLLTGRLMLKDVRYHSSNMTVDLVKLQLIWRYWIWRPTSEDEIGLKLDEDCMSLYPFVKKARAHLV